MDKVCKKTEKGENSRELPRPPSSRKERRVEGCVRTRPTFFFVLIFFLLIWSPFFPSSLSVVGIRGKERGTMYLPQWRWTWKKNGHNKARNKSRRDGKRTQNPVNGRRRGTSPSSRPRYPQVPASAKVAPWSQLVAKTGASVSGSNEEDTAKKGRSSESLFTHASGKDKSRILIQQGGMPEPTPCTISSSLRHRQKHYRDWPDTLPSGANRATGQSRAVPSSFDASDCRHLAVGSE